MTEDPTKDPNFVGVRERERELVARGIDPYNEHEAGNDYVPPVASLDEPNVNSNGYMNRMEAYQGFLDRNRHLNSNSSDEMHRYRVSELVKTFPAIYGVGGIQDLIKYSRSQVNHIFKRRLEFVTDYIRNNSPSSRT